MKMQFKTVACASAMALLFTACQKESSQPLTEQGAVSLKLAAQSLQANDIKSSGAGHVYTLNNAVAGNRVMDFKRSADGQLSFNASFATGGNGSGTGLGNQGALTLTDNAEFLLAVNAGSNSISSFKINDNDLVLISTIASGGVRPVSITQHEHNVYVLNAGGTNNIAGFKLNDNGMLQAIPNSTRPLSAASTGPAQVSFVSEGNAVAITEKATNKIVTYTITESGMPGAMHTITSSSPTPFGFAAGKQSNIFVSEAVGGAPGASVLSSYHINNDGSISLIDGSNAAGQSAACWVVLTNNGKFAYTTNTANANISAFGIDNWGSIAVSQAIAATTQAGPIDAALSNNSKFLYVLNGAGNSLQGYAVSNDGSLSFLQTMPGLPTGANGLAAR